MTYRIGTRSALSLIAALLLSTTAQAQLFRAYLAPSGNDANPCNLSQPCRLLPAALAAVADGGEIRMLDSANYNTAQVSITKSVTILAVPGALGSVVAAGGSAIDIATAGVEVALRNLVIVPLPGGSATRGINMSLGTALTVENCLIANLPQQGIFVSNAASVRITDSTIRDNTSAGVWLEGGARAIVTRATFIGNPWGVYVYGNGANTTSADVSSSTMGDGQAGVVAYSVHASGVLKVSVRDSLITRNTDNGIIAQSTAGASVTLSASSNTISNNTTGIKAFSGTGAKVWASANTVSDNTTGLHHMAGVFESAGNNAVRNNGTDKIGTITVVAME